MKFDHLGIWVDDIESIRQFYVTYFNAVCSHKYFNPKRNFTSYFLSFQEGDGRIELMHTPDLRKSEYREQMRGLAHFAISIGSKEAVDVLTERLRKDGCCVVGEPRTTGDGYYESVVLDPEGNRVELIA